MTVEKRSLGDKWIAITRPIHQTHTLAKNIKKVGGWPLCFPLIEIIPSDRTSTKQQLLMLNDYDVLIFISANAVEECFNVISPNTIKTPSIATTGKKTAQALSNKGLSVTFCPEKHFNSEALLAIPEFKTKIKQSNNTDNKKPTKVAIIRGEGGRELLRDELLKTGASVDYIDVYKRYCPQENLNLLKEQWQQQKLDVVLLTSALSTAHFFRLANDEAWINELTLLIGSPRMQKEIPAQFKGKILIAEDPSDETLYKKLNLEYG